jgi:hypothetical protein
MSQIVNMRGILLANVGSPKRASNFPLGNRPSALWKLNALYKVGAKFPLKVIYPRPDGETPVTALHRKANSNWQYECRICVQGGEPPFKMAITSGPSGATLIGEFARSTDSVTGLTLHSFPVDYGVVKWPNPSGTANFTVRVTDQSDNFVDVSWSSVTDDSAFVVLDAVNGNDANSGTFASPKRTFVTGLWKNSQSDNTFATKIAAFKAGTYPIYQVTANNSVEVTGGIKPLSYLGIESGVVFDTSQGHFYVNTGNVAMRNIRIDGSMFATEANVRIIQASVPCDNVHFSKLTFSNIGQGTVKSDNVSCIMFVNNYPDYSHNVSFTECKVESTCLVQFHSLFSVDGILDENNEQLDADMPAANGALTFAYKDDIKNLTARFNRTSGPSATFHVMNQQQGAGGSVNQELCYNFLSTTTSSDEAGPIQWNQNSTVYDNAANTHCYRNTIVTMRYAASAQRWVGGDKTIFSVNLHTASDTFGFSYSSGVQEDVAHPNVFISKANLNNSTGVITNSTSRIANLGKVGAEIAST